MLETILIFKINYTLSCAVCTSKSCPDISEENISLHVTLRAKSSLFSLICLQLELDENA